MVDWPKIWILNSHESWAHLITSYYTNFVLYIGFIHVLGIRNLYWKVSYFRNQVSPLKNPDLGAPLIGQACQAWPLIGRYSAHKAGHANSTNHAPPTHPGTLLRNQFGVSYIFGNLLFVPRLVAGVFKCSLISGSPLLLGVNVTLSGSD